MWLLGIAAIIIAAAVIINFLVKWLNSRRKRRLDAAQNEENAALTSVNDQHFEDKD